jgi:hypothetical protein
MRVTDYAALSPALLDDVIPIVDIHDTTMDPTGTTKKITVSSLRYQPWQFLPETYGAKGDGKVIGDAAITAGTAILTSASANFTSADVGKTFMLNGALGAAAKPLITTILSQQSGMQVTLSANATATVTGGAAVYGTDDTAAINSAVTAAVTYAEANNYHAQVIYGPNVYVLAAAPVTSASPSQSAQIPLPWPAVDGSSRKLILEFIGTGNGEATQYWEGKIPNVQGTILASCYYNSSGTSSVIGGPNASTGLTGGFANVKPVMTGLTIVIPWTNQAIDMDFRYCASASVDRCSFMSFASVLAGQAPLASTIQSTSSTGIYMPIQNNNADNTIGTVTVESHGYAVASGEHLVAHRITAVYCNVGLFCESTSAAVHHGLTILQLCVEATNTAIQCIQASGQIPIFIGLMDTESINTKDFDDQHSVLVGTVNWADWERTTINVNGAANLKIVNTRLAPGVWGSAPAVPASASAQVNTSYRDAWVNVQPNGATISAIAVDATTLTGITSGLIRVPSGHSITLTYTVATPAWQWVLD